MKRVKLEVKLSDEQYAAWESETIRRKTGLALLSTMGSGGAPVSFSKKSMDDALKEEIRRAVWEYFQELKEREDGRGKK